MEIIDEKQNIPKMRTTFIGMRSQNNADHYLLEHSSNGLLGIPKISWFGKQFASLKIKPGSPVYLFSNNGDHEIRTMLTKDEQQHVENRPK